MTYYERLRERHVGWYTSPPAGAILEKRGGEAGLAKASTMGFFAVRKAIETGMKVDIQLIGWWHERPTWHEVRQPENGHGRLFKVVTRGIDPPPAGIETVRAALRQGYDEVFADTDIVHVFGVDRATVDQYRDALSVVPEDAPIEPDQLWIPDHLKLGEQ